MAKKTNPTLDRLPLVDTETGDFTVVLETPKGSRNKYRYDAGCRAIRLSATLGEGLAFPYDFGFFPSTLGDDGDPLDVLLFLDEAVPPGSVATARLIGVLEVEQKGKGKPWRRNDRFFAVATHAHTHQSLKRLDDLREHLLPEIESFFVHYAELNGKRLRIIGRRGSTRARKLLKAGARTFDRKR
jgi:inorganic pyrophosphatase